MSYTKGVAILEALVAQFNIPKGAAISIKTKAFEEYDPGFKFERMGDKNTFVGVDLKDLRRTPEGLFDGCVVYICDISGNSRDPEDLPKWHVDYCGTLEAMERNGRLFKYTAHVGGSPNFQFFRHGDKNASFYRKPRACAKCMAILSTHKRGYRDAHTYTVKQYIDEFGSDGELNKTRSPSGKRAVTTDRFLQPNDPNFKHNAYNPDFMQKALEHKRARPFCECCKHRFALNDLNVHHKNRKKYDDRVENWAVLCLLCHCIEHAKDNASMINMEVKNGTMAAFLTRNPSKQRDYVRHIEKLPSYPSLLSALPKTP